MHTQPQQQPPQPAPPPERRKRTQQQSTEVRLAIVETRWQDVVPTLATKADLNEAVGLSKMEIKREIADLRTELKGDIAGLRAELKGDIAELRTEFKGEIAGLRTELKGDIADWGQLSACSLDLGHCISPNSAAWIQQYHGLSGCMYPCRLQRRRPRLWHSHSNQIDHRLPTHSKPRHVTGAFLHCLT